MSHVNISDVDLTILLVILDYLVIFLDIYRWETIFTDLAHQGILMRLVIHHISVLFFHKLNLLCEEILLHGDLLLQEVLHLCTLVLFFV